MFFLVQRYEVSQFSAGHLQNPQTPEQRMTLSFVRTRMRMAICTVHSRKAAGDFWDVTTNNKVPRRLWTPEMKAFYQSRYNEVPKPPFVFKLTVLGWILSLLVAAFFGFIIYNSAKPPFPKPVQAVAMAKAPAVGAIYFGHYEKYKEKGTPIGSEIGYGWFIIKKVTDDDFYLAKSTGMSKSFKAKEQLESTRFETETLPPLKLSEQTGYNIRFKSTDGLTEVYITDKK
ncbi:hypothetical protein [Niabella drilacis]|uniref:Uncharacterized protein n=1 Tax=Niabella drilacis (strain DSM 25811 / CCM 8410 / CCUG 62505 / LMG 26954 / E90) TaxID=1285928 RepID=A0A1G6TFP3_NIADE|nr:hypothetical protein [Niabella drilacis]SDD27145.1 hypothetical protein SAMN04487894_107180 [Niabella drilacis]